MSQTTRPWLGKDREEAMRSFEAANVRDEAGVCAWASQQVAGPLEVRSVSRGLLVTVVVLTHEERMASGDVFVECKVKCDRSWRLKSATYKTMHW